MAQRSVRLGCAFCADTDDAHTAAMAYTAAYLVEKARARPQFGLLGLSSRNSSRRPGVATSAAIRQLGRRMAELVDRCARSPAGSRTS